MGTTNNGSQIFTFGYQQSGTTTVKSNNSFNKLNYKLCSPGVISGGTFTRTDDTTVSISAMVWYMEDPDNLVGVRMETLGTASVTVSTSATYIVARYSWPLITSTYVDFVGIDYSALQTGDIILGKVNYSSTTMSTTFDYSMRQWSQLYYQKANQGYPSFWVTATAPYSTSVKVYPGTAVVGGSIVSISSVTTSPAFTFPVSSNGRTDVLCLNSSGSLEIIEGTDTSGAPTPDIPINVLPLAKISFGASSSTYSNVVYGNFITFLDPTNTPIIIDSNTTTEAGNADTLASTTPSTLGLALLSGATASADRTSLGLGTYATLNIETRNSVTYTFSSSTTSISQSSTETSAETIYLTGTITTNCTLNLYLSSSTGRKNYTIISTCTSATQNLYIIVQTSSGTYKIYIPVTYSGTTIVSVPAYSVVLDASGSVYSCGENPLIQSSSYGYYEKYSNGKMISYSTGSNTVSISVGWYNLYVSDNLTWAYPCSYTLVTALSATQSNASSDWAWVMSVSGGTSNFVYKYAKAVASSSSITYYPNIRVEGFWK